LPEKDIVGNEQFVYTQYVRTTFDFFTCQPFFRITNLK
jgi:hypothetical protein